MEDERLVEQIRLAYDRGWQVYGSPRIHAKLLACGIVCGKHRVERLMRQTGLRAVRIGHRNRVRELANLSEPFGGQTLHL